MLVSILKLTVLVEDELWRKSLNIHEFGSNSTYFRVTSQRLRKQLKTAAGCRQDKCCLDFNQFLRKSTYPALKTKNEGSVTSSVAPLRGQSLHSFPVSCLRTLPRRGLEAVIKWASSAASPVTHTSAETHKKHKKRNVDNYRAPTRVAPHWTHRLNEEVRAA